MIEYEDIPEIGGENPAGMSRRFYYARIKDIQVLPKLKKLDDAQNLEEAGMITGDIVMKPGKSFKVMEIAMNSGGLNSSEQGELKSKSASNTFTVRYPYITAQVIGLKRSLRNDDLVLILEERSGQKRLFGDSIYPAQLSTGETATGAATADPKGNNLTFMTEGQECPVWTGNVVLSSSSPGDGGNQVIFT